MERLWTLGVTTVVKVKGKGFEPGRHYSESLWASSGPVKLFGPTEGQEDRPIKCQGDSLDRPKAREYLEIG